MKPELVEKVTNMSDFQVIRCYQALCRTLFSAVDANMEELVAQVPPQLAAADEIKSWSNLPEQEVSTPLTTPEAAVVARTTLLEMVRNPQTSAVTEDFLTKYKETEMAAGTLLAIGGVISMIMLVATSKFEIKNGKVELSIGGNRNPEELKALGGLITEIIKSIPNVILEKLKGLENVKN